MNRLKNMKGFTLLELIIVIIIIGVLATLGLVQYKNLSERARGAEAKDVLTQLRKAQVAYYSENTAYAADIANLYISGLPAQGVCAASHYFAYSTANTGTSTATRCIGANGKQPGGAAAPAPVWSITLDIGGTLTEVNKP